MTSSVLIRWQGLLFSLVAWLIVGLGAVFTNAASQGGLLIFFLVVFFLGVPHGALDTVYARHLFRLQSLWAWLTFGLTYVGLALMVVALWLITPLMFLVGFLLVSAFHFSGDPEGDTPFLFRALYGGAIIVFPALLHVQQVTELFTFLSGAPTAERVAGALHWIAIPWLLAVFLAAGYHVKKSSLSCLELISVSALAVLAPPLIAFGVFFCTMHSVRHILRTRRISEKKSFLQLFQVALPPFLLTLLGASTGWYFLQDESFDARVVQLLFVSLAALTVPHMMLVDRMRFFGRGSMSGSNS